MRFCDLMPATTEAVPSALEIVVDAGGRGSVFNMGKLGILSDLNTETGDYRLAPPGTMVGTFDTGYGGAM